MPKSELDEAIIGTCDNCGSTQVYVRPVESMDTFHRGSRGWYKICFDCSRPTFEIKTPRGIVNTPMKEEHYQKWLKKKMEE
jgi:hypothetical protein